MKLMFLVILSDHLVILSDFEWYPPYTGVVWWNILADAAYHRKLRVSVEPRVQSFFGKVKTELTDSELCLEFLHIATSLSAEPLDG